MYSLPRQAGRNATAVARKGGCASSHTHTFIPLSPLNPLPSPQRCAWDDLLLGALPAWATLTILCTCAFLVGCLLTGLLARWRHNAAFYGDGAAARAADAEALPSPASEFVGRRRPDAFKTPGTLAKEDAVRAAGVTGPLGVGAVVG